LQCAWVYAHPVIVKKVKGYWKCDSTRRDGYAEQACIEGETDKILGEGREDGKGEKDIKR